MKCLSCFLPSVWVRGIFIVCVHNSSQVSNLLLCESASRKIVHREFQMACGHNSREGVFVISSVYSSENVSENISAIPALLILPDYQTIGVCNTIGLPNSEQAFGVVSRRFLLYTGKYLIVWELVQRTLPFPLLIARAANMFCNCLF